MAIRIDPEKCNGCSKCVEICPVNAIKIESEKAVVNDECIECGVCVEACSVGAIFLKKA